MLCKLNFNLKKNFLNSWRFPIEVSVTAFKAHLTFTTVTHLLQLYSSHTGLSGHSWITLSMLQPQAFVPSPWNTFSSNIKACCSSASMPSSKIKTLTQSSLLQPCFFSAAGGQRLGSVLLFTMVSLVLTREPGAYRSSLTVKWMNDTGHGVRVSITSTEPSTRDCGDQSSWLWWSL